MDETAQDNPMSIEQPRSIEEAQVAKAVEQASGFEQFRRAGEIKSPADLAPSVQAVKGVENMAQQVESDEERSRREQAEREFAELTHLESLTAERSFRKIERASVEELEYYSPEQVGLLFLRKIENTLVALQEYGKMPEDFRWVSQSELRELEKVIQTLEELPTSTVQQRIRQGYPEIRMEHLVKMGNEQLGDYIKIDRALKIYRSLQEAVVLEPRELRLQQALEATILVAAKKEGVERENKEESISELDKLVRRKVQDAIKETFGSRAEKLKALEKAMIGFNHIVEFYGEVQKPLSAEVREYHHFVGNAARRDKVVPTGSDYKGLFFAPELLPDTPPLSQLIEGTLRPLLDVVMGEEENMPNIYIREPSAEKRRQLLEFLENKLFYDQHLNDKEIVIDPSKEMHKHLANVAARIALLLIHHWDVHESAVCAAEYGEEGKFKKITVETSYGDQYKMQFPAARAIGEWKAFRSPFGNPAYTGAMFALTDNYLKVVAPLLESNDGISLRVSLWDLIKTHGFSLKDVPWLGEDLIIDPNELIIKEEKDEGKITAQRLPLNLRTNLQNIKYRGESKNWKKMTGFREDSLAVPWGLHLAYLGAFYDAMTTTNFAKLLENMGNVDFWDDFNKGFDIGSKIYLSSRGLNEETIFKLMLIAKINLVAGINAAIQDKQMITDVELRRLRTRHGGGAGLSEQEIFDAIFKSGFLAESMNVVKIGQSEYPINIDVRNLINNVKKQKRGIVPGDVLIKDLFSNIEIQQIENSKVYRPYRLHREKEFTDQKGKDPLYIIDALEDAIANPLDRA
ncbi:hypothetical protein HY404_02495 [Candidatus Microgenomates bacterium]|nr:hypothetical protein [Candidatus Microgenomates bacterium]